MDRGNVVAKLGLRQWREGDDELMAALQELMLRGEMDMTIGFRALSRFDPQRPDPEVLAAAFYSPERQLAVQQELQTWLQRYAARLREDPLPAAVRLEQMRLANPKFVLRNYLAQQAIERAEQGDAAAISELLAVMRHPYDEQPGNEAFAQRRPDWAREKAGCSMLSCSS